ncbi:MAG: hypothetical protein ACI9QD_001191, partial [Thermoproteota archaeon]
DILDFAFPEIKGLGLEEVDVQIDENGRANAIIY